MGGISAKRATGPFISRPLAPLGRSLEWLVWFWVSLVQVRMSVQAVRIAHTKLLRLKLPTLVISLPFMKDISPAAVGLILRPGVTLFVDIGVTDLGDSGARG